MRCVTFAPEEGEDRPEHVGTNIGMLYCLYTILRTMIYFTNCFGIITNYFPWLRLLFFKYLKYIFSPLYESFDNKALRKVIKSKRKAVTGRYTMLYREDIYYLYIHDTVTSINKSKQHERGGQV